MHVLAAGVDPAEHRERARVLADHRDSHDGHLHWHQHLVPVGEEAVESVAGERRGARRLPALAGFVRVGDEPRERRFEHVEPRRHGARLLRNGFEGLGRPEHHDRHREVHRLQQREPQRRPADRVQIGAAAGHLAMELGVRQVDRADPEQVERRVLLEARQQVGAGHARPALGLVDDHGGPRELAGVERAGVDDAVLDHAASPSPPASQKSALKWVTWTSSRSSRSAIGWRSSLIRPCGALCST